uniref:30S ribosomal protein S4 n=1 Tax=Vertebrata lanosa TaxID=1261582 RepID=A0A0B5W3L4_9FLOR|nr:30S ribosomal protein S4 [Vertebrata lanosa]AJH65995.1 30S ribosomal protein S4 [Vertebrata lanosa]
MSRYRGPRLKILRRLGELPGLTRKQSNKTYPAGEHGQQIRKPSEYALRLEEKQKIRYNYGLSEKQMLKNIKLAKKVQGSTGVILLQILEMRLDNTIFRLGLAPTIPSARQLVNHKHVLINDKIVSICSYQCKPGDVIKIKDKKSSNQIVKKHFENPSLANLPNHLEINKDTLIGKVNGIVERDWVGIQLNELLVVEYYSKK